MASLQQPRRQSRRRRRSCRRPRPGPRRCSSPSGGSAARRCARIASKALETTVPPVAGLWKKVSSSTSSASVGVPDEHDLDMAVAPREEDVEQHVEALGEILHVLGHRARHVHQAEHHRLRRRAWARSRSGDSGCRSDRYRECAASWPRAPRFRLAAPRDPPRPRNRRASPRAVRSSAGLGRRSAMRRAIARRIVRVTAMLTGEPDTE